MSLSETFLLFCENAEIRVEAVNPVQYGELYRVSRNGEYAYMTIFDNGNSLPQGQTGSSLYRILQTWSNTVPGSRILSEEERHSLSSLGIPDFYLSWREWDEDADFIQGFINEKGEPEESSASDSYKIHREIMFHDYMFKQATNLVISLEAVRYVITNWLFHFCFMNIDANTLADLVISRLKQFWKEQITADGCVSFYAVVQELPYLFTRYCHDKWVACNSQVVCPQIGNEDACLVELVDSMYVYCQNQHVLSYTKTNLHRLLERKYNLLNWISLNPSSPIEKLLGDALYQSGFLTIPQYQPLAPVRKFRVDYLIKAPHGGALAIECDGLEYHANKKAYMLDRRRDNLLTSSGFQVLRFSSVDIYNDLEGCIRQIEDCFSNFQHGRVVYHRNEGLGYFGSRL